MLSTFCQRALCCMAVAVALTAPAQAEPPESFKQMRTEAVVEADGRATQTIHVEIAVNNEATARAEGQQSLVYNDDLDAVELIEGATVKPDGRRVPVLPSAVHTQLAPGVPNLPEFTSRKRITAIMPDLQGGDVVALTWRKTIKPIFPGVYSATYAYSRLMNWDDVDATISVPQGMNLTTQSRGPEQSQTDRDGRTIYRWRWHAAAVASDPAALSPLDRWPAIFASTLPDWQAFSRVYAAVMTAKTQVTPRVQALADEIALKATDRREQAKLVYDWVSRHIRWVAVYVNDGDFVPHEADAVLANGYGDCKDQVALMIALLRARGIAAEPVVLNLGPSYTLSGPATLSAFNHVITYMPEFDLYADTTPGGAPFGTLPVSEYGKPILHVTADGAPASRMAVLPENLATERLRSTMRLEPDGRVTGESTTEATGPYATALRMVAARVMTLGGERAAIDQLKSLSQPGQGEITTAPLDAIGPDYSVSARFTLDARPGMVEGESFTVPTGMRLLARPGDGPLGLLALGAVPASEPMPCYAARQEEELALALPPGFHVVKLPKPRRIDDGAFTYESAWSLDEDILHVTRRMVSRIDQPLCTGTLRAVTAKALKDIQRDFGAQVALEKDG